MSRPRTERDYPPLARRGRPFERSWDSGRSSRRPVSRRAATRFTSRSTSCGSSGVEDLLGSMTAAVVPSRACKSPPTPSNVPCTSARRNAGSLRVDPVLRHEAIERSLSKQAVQQLAETSVAVPAGLRLGCARRPAAAEHHAPGQEPLASEPLAAQGQTACLQVEAVDAFERGRGIDLEDALLDLGKTERRRRSVGTLHFDIHRGSVRHGDPVLAQGCPTHVQRLIHKILDTPGHRSVPRSVGTWRACMSLRYDSEAVRARLAEVDRMFGSAGDG